MAITTKKAKIRVASGLTTTNSSGLEVDAIVLGPFAIHPVINRGVPDPKLGWKMTHIKTGLSLPAQLRSESLGVLLARQIILDNPNLCWNFGEFGKFTGIGANGLNISKYGEIFHAAREKLGIPRT